MIVPEVTDPLNVMDIVPAQTVWFGPASTTGAGVIVIIMVSVIGVQPAVEVRTIVTVPFAVSAELGM